MSDAPQGLGAIDTNVPQMQATSSHSAKIGRLGTEVVSTLYMLIRNVRLHDPTNAVFEKPFSALRDAINTIVGVEGSFNLQAVGTTVYLNGKQLRMDFTSLENVKYLTEEFKKKDVGGFAVQRAVQLKELQDFIWIFSRENAGAAEEDGAGNRKLANIKVGKFAKIKEQLEKEEENELDQARQVDRKKYALTVYARTVYFMKKFIERLREAGTLPNVAKAGRIVQDLVDLCFEQKSHFLGMTTTRSLEEYLEYHSVNTALLCIVFGNELAMSRAQLHELAMAALFHDIGMAEIPMTVLSKPKGLSKDERRMVDLFPLFTVKTMLKGRMLDQASVKRMVAAYECKVDYSLPMKQPDGSIKLMMPKVELGIYGKIISICATYDALTSARPFREAYGPEVAMTLMVGDMKYKFDPVLLKIFMKVVAIQPVKVLKKGTTIEIG
jgi:HD-GYP domain-containing protein (c-di-GMP phosphodiesterase class II)